MIEQIHGPIPPTQIEMHAKFDAEWKGADHTDVCVRLHNGFALLEVRGAPQYYVVYATPKTDVYGNMYASKDDPAVSFLELSQTRKDFIGESWACVDIGGAQRIDQK